MPPKKPGGKAAPAEAEPSKPELREPPGPARWRTEMELMWNAAQAEEAGSDLLMVAPPPPRPPDPPPQGVTGGQALLLHARWCEYYYSLRLHCALRKHPALAAEAEAARNCVHNIATGRGLTPHERTEMRCREDRERDRYFPRRLRPGTLRALREHYGFDVQNEGFWASRLKKEVELTRTLTASGLEKYASALNRAGVRLGEVPKLPQIAMEQLGLTEPGDRRRLQHVLGAASKARRRLRRRPAPGSAHQNRRRPLSGHPAADAADPIVALGSPRCGMPGLSVYDYRAVDEVARRPLPEFLGPDATMQQVAEHLGAEFAELTWRNNAEQRAHHTVRAVFVWLATNITPGADGRPEECFQRREAGGAAFAAIFQEMCRAALCRSAEVDLPTRAVVALGMADTWQGVVITAVPVDGVAIKRGVRRGMLIASINGQEVPTEGEVRSALQNAGVETVLGLTESGGVGVTVVAGRHPGLLGLKGDPIQGAARWWNVVQWPSLRRSFVDVWGAAGGGLPQPPARRPVGWHWATPPRQFISSHFPVPPDAPRRRSSVDSASAAAAAAAAAAGSVPDDNPQALRLQLLRTPVSSALWALLPAFCPAAYAHGITLAGHNRARVMVKQPPLYLEFGLQDPSVELRAELRRGPYSAPEGRTPLPWGYVFESRCYSRSTTYFTVIPPEPGEYVFELAVRRPPHPAVAAQEAAGSLPDHVHPPPFEHALSLQLMSAVKLADEPLLAHQVCPTTVAQLIEPLYGKIEQGSPVQFAVSAVTLSRERPRNWGTGSAKSRGSAPPSSRSTVAPPPPPPERKGAAKGKQPPPPPPPPPPEEPPRAVAPAHPEHDWPIAGHCLAYNAARGVYEGQIPSLKRGIVDVFVRIAGRFVPLVEGISVVRQVPAEERELNNGRPLVAVVDSEEERAAVLTRLTYGDPPAPQPAAAACSGPAEQSPAAPCVQPVAPLAQVKSLSTGSLPRTGDAEHQHVDAPPCPSPSPPPDEPLRLFKFGASRAVGGYWADRQERDKSVQLPDVPMRAATSLGRPVLSRMSGRRKGDSVGRPASWPLRAKAHTPNPMIAV
eukprot:TRINITY_DN9004_c1_g3_i2.p1 TRINITY_DN9004_c1_g3~~TRINITY_DN9004_c1_g3_i2.p1  ORF type:complete len:1092 (+),score=197.01 TRINITY_DN9004_c1_g3_i2:79-3276(+)